MTNKINGDDLVYPTTIIEDISSDEGYSGTRETYHMGLSKREYFAAMAMQGLASCITFDWTKVAATDSEACAIRAVQYADALISELNKPLSNDK